MFTYHALSHKHTSILKLDFIEVLSRIIQFPALVFYCKPVICGFLKMLLTSYHSEDL